MLRLLLLRMVRLLRMLAVRRCIAAAAAATWAPIIGLLSPVHPALLLLLLSLEVRRVGVGVVLHGCELAGVDAGEIWRMLRAPAATVLLQEGAVPGGAARLVVLLQLLVAEGGVAGQRRTGAPAARDRPVGFRAGCCCGRPGGGGSVTGCAAPGDDSRFRVRQIGCPCAQKAGTQVGCGWAQRLLADEPHRDG